MRPVKLEDKESLAIMEVTVNLESLGKRELKGVKGKLVLLVSQAKMVPKGIGVKWDLRELPVSDNCISWPF